MTATVLRHLATKGGRLVTTGYDLYVDGAFRQTFKLRRDAASEARRINAPMRAQLIAEASVILAARDARIMKGRA
jgi:hypothetical protein